MSQQTDKDAKPGQARYCARIGELFLMVNSSELDIQCKTLAMTDWSDLRTADVAALLAPLATHPIADERSLVALVLATTVGVAQETCALQALVTLAVDDDPAVRAAAGQSSDLAREINLTHGDQSATSLAERLVDWRQEDEATFSFRCTNLAVAKRLRAIITGLSVREMTHRSDETQTRPAVDKFDDVHGEPTRLPDVIMGGTPPQASDLPRRGTPKAVINVAKSSVRLPDVLVDE